MYESILHFTAQHRMHQTSKEKMFVIGVLQNRDFKFYQYRKSNLKNMATSLKCKLFKNISETQ